jgi:hypothetical protein
MYCITVVLPCLLRFCCGSVYCSLHVVIVGNFGEMSYSITESCRYSAFSYTVFSLATQLSHLASHLSHLDPA